LPPKELNDDEEGEVEETHQDLSHKLAIRVGQFSVQIPGQRSVQINIMAFGSTPVC
jgi:hypothetical protein